jgi:hypothetical protein
MYKVLHSEKYLLVATIKIFNSFNEILERYSTYAKEIEKYREKIELGERVEILYDFYITLTIEKVES